LQPSVGFDIFVTYLDEFFASSLQPIQAAVDTVMDFANQFIRMEAENACLREVVKSPTEQLEKANKLATEVQGEAANLRKELDLLKSKIKEEEQQKIEAQARADKKEGDLRKSIETLLGKMFRLLYCSFLAKLFYLIMLILHNISGAADMPIDHTNRLRIDSMSDAISFAVDSSDQIQELLKKVKGALSKLFSLIFLKLGQKKTLEELVNAFFIDTDMERLYGGTETHFASLWRASCVPAFNGIRL
jgi:uncharacterized coiled-coil protein SlyX